MRRAAVFVLLAAVFFMHGIPFLGADDAARAGGMTHAAMVSTLDGTPASDVAAVDESMNGSAEAASGPTGHRSTPIESHGMDVHLWGACLAIVFAGIALLVVFLLSRRRPWSWPGRTASFSIVTRTRLAVIRPPDLSVLCVLRT